MSLAPQPDFFVNNLLNPRPFFLHPVPQFSVATTTGLGYPSGLKELRSGSDLRVELDHVVQAILRSTCTDGFRAGFEAGLRAAIKGSRTTGGSRAESRSRDGDSGSVDKKDEALARNLETCSQVKRLF